MRDAESPAIEQQVAPERAERRYVYNGEASPVNFEGMPRGNRPVRTRRRSPFIIVVFLFAVSIVIVFYIWNKITVNRLAVEVSDLRAQYEKIANGNAVLRDEITRKSKLERISAYAKESLGLTYRKDQPISFEVPFDRLRELNEY